MQIKAIAALVPMLKRRANHLSRSDDSADDLVQETVLRLLSARARGRRIDNPEAYAMRILTNCARSSRRRAQNWVALEEDMATCDADAPRRIACAELAEVMARLPPQQARLLKMVAEGETSPRALSKRIGVPDGTVMSRLARARARLRRELHLAPKAPVRSLWERD